MVQRTVGKSSVKYNRVKNFKARLTAWTLSFVMVFSIMPKIDRNLPVKVQAETVVGRAGISLDYANVKAGESDYDAFIRIGQEFYDTYINGNYTSTGARNGGEEKVFTLESVYALEYAMNKDILSDEAVSGLTSGSDKVVDLPTYAERVNVFCAESIDKMPLARKSTDVPSNNDYDASVGEEEREWSVDGKGIPIPDFDDLSLLGRDLLSCESLYDFMYHYAVLDKNALWEGDYNESGMLVNGEGNLIVGWVKLPNGDTTVQACYGHSTELCQFYNTEGYSMVMSDNLFYLFYDNVLLKKNTTINFAKDMDVSNRAWYDEGEAEDRDFTWIMDEDYSVCDDDMKDMVGLSNYRYINLAENMGSQKMFYIADISKPKERTAEYETSLELKSAGEAEITIDRLSSEQLSVVVDGDDDGWYGNHLFLSSSDDKVAAVDNSGKIYGISEGTAVITVITKTSGRVKPLQVTVHVKGARDSELKVSVGYTTEDCVYVGSEVYLDKLTDEVVEDNGAAVIIVEQPIFTVNGVRNYDPSTKIEENDELKLERWIHSAGCGALPMEEYKRLSEKLHKEGKKLYICYQSFWSTGFENVSFMAKYSYKMLDAYNEDPTNEEASIFVDKLFNAYKEYFTKYGPSYDKAGVDGVLLPDGMGGGSKTLYINDGHWSDLIETIRKAYSGEVKAYIDKLEEPEKMQKACLDNDDLFSNVDSIIFHASDELPYYFNKDNPSLEECKKVIQEKIGTFTDALYERYGKPIDTDWNITSTKHLTVDRVAGKGESLYVDRSDYSMNPTTADYLQQLITWEAIMELYSEKEYTGMIFARYVFMNWKIFNQNYDIRSGYDCSATVHRKPAAKLLASWSTGEVPSADSRAKCEIDNVGGEVMPYDFYTMKNGESKTIGMKDKTSEYTFYSSDSAVVSVDANGEMKAVKPGKSLIVIRYADDASVKKSFTVYVMPSGSDCAVEQYDKVLGVLSGLKAAGCKISANMFTGFYELATRINEPEFSEDEISEMVDCGIFDYNTGKQYTEFVLGLKDYGDKVSLNDLKVSGNTVCKCDANADYIYNYVVKNPHDGNLYRNINWVNVDTEIAGKYESEFQHDDGTQVYGWAVPVASENVSAQYFIKDSVSDCTPYFSNLILTGGRFYFVYAWDVCRGSTTVKLDGKSINVTLEEDGGIAESDFKETLDDVLGSGYYDNMMARYDKGEDIDITATKPAHSGGETDDSGNDGTDGNGGEDYGFRLVKFDMGYPTDTILDFTCEDVIYDGVSTLSPEVTKNYCGGEVAFTYKKSGSDTWTDKAPNEAGTYTVRAVAAPGNGCRKTICEKTAKITEKSSEDQSYIPTNVTVAQDGAFVEVSWECGGDVTRYKVLERLGGEKEYSVCGYTERDSLRVPVKSCDATAEYAVCAMQEGSYGEASEPVSITTLSHHIIYKEAKTAMPNDDGYKAHYACEYCGSIYADESGNETITEDDISIEKNLLAELYSDDAFNEVKETLGYYETVSDLNEVIGSKTGYLKVTLYDGKIGGLPGENAAGIDGVFLNTDESDKAIVYTGQSIELNKDLYVASDLVVPDKGILIEGNDKSLYLGGICGKDEFGGVLKVSGGAITAEDLSVYCAGFVRFDTDMSGIKLLALNEWIGKDKMTEDNAWVDGNKRLADGSLIIAGNLSDIGELQTYCSRIYIQHEGSLSVDSVTGLFGEIMLQKAEDDTLAKLTVNSTMEEMIWQVRLFVYENLEEDNLDNMALVGELDQGTVLAYIPDTADSSCAKNLGYLPTLEDDPDNWGIYEKKLWQDGRLYYDDGSAEIPRLKDDGNDETGGDTGETGGDTGETGGSTGETGGDTGETGGSTGETGDSTDKTGDKTDETDVKPDETDEKTEKPSENTGEADEKAAKPVETTGGTEDKTKEAEDKTKETEGNTKETSEKTDNTNDNTVDVLKEGDTVKDTASGASFVVVTPAKATAGNGAASNGEATYTGIAAGSTSAKVVIPDTVTDSKGVTYTVTKIADNALKGNKTVKEVTIGNNIVEIGEGAFQNAAKLTTVKLGKNVTTIDKNAFAGCAKLKKVTASGSKITTIADGAFKNDKLITSIDLSKSKVKTIGKNAFSGDKKLKTVKLNANALKKVGKNAFKNVRKNAIITVMAKDKNTYNKAVKLIKKSGAKNVKYKYKKKK